jgi:hypothetical protein
MAPEEFIKRYPLLWHMADGRNTAGIFQRGLLSTSALLDLFGIEGAERERIETTRRPESVTLSNSKHGMVVVRDQKPMSLKRIERCLTSGTPQEFFRFLNGRVFFWPTEEKLATMNNARAYRDTNQLVFVVRTESLVAAHGSRIRVSPINSGATSPFAWPRSVTIFETLSAFNFAARKKCANPIAEVTVSDRVTDILEHIERLEVWRGGQLQRILRQPYSAASVARRLA